MRAHAKRLWQWCGTTEGKLFIVLLAVALGIRLLLAPYRGFSGDNQVDVTWGLYLGRNFFHVYSAVGSYNNPLVYPPFMVYFFGLMDGIYFVIERLIGGHPTYDVTQAPLLNVLVKLPVLLADLATISLIYNLSRRMYAKKWALLVAATYAFSPGVLFDGALWGQTDGVPTLFVFLALFLVLERRAFWAGIALGLALVTKPQPAIFVPLILIYLWHWRGRREGQRALIGMAVSMVVVCLPYLLPPIPEILIYLKNVGGWVGGGREGYAFNLWWIVDPQFNFSPPYWMPVAGTLLGWTLFFLTYFIVIKGIRRESSPKTFLLGAAIIAIAFFTVNTLQLDRYLYPAMALLLAAALYDKRIWPLYAVANITIFLNLAIYVMHYDGTLYQAAPQWRDFLTLHAQATTILQNSIAWLNIALLLSALAIYLLDLRHRLAAPVQDADTTSASLIASEEASLNTLS